MSVADFVSPCVFKCFYSCLRLFNESEVFFFKVRAIFVVCAHNPFQFISNSSPTRQGVFYSEKVPQVNQTYFHDLHRMEDRRRITGQGITSVSFLYISNRIRETRDHVFPSNARSIKPNSAILGHLNEQPMR